MGTYDRDWYREHARERAKRFKGRRAAQITIAVLAVLVAVLVWQWPTVAETITATTSTVATMTTTERPKSTVRWSAAPNVQAAAEAIAICRAQDEFGRKLNGAGTLEAWRAMPEKRDEIWGHIDENPKERARIRYLERIMQKEACGYRLKAW